jgi:hypothetical protein
MNKQNGRKTDRNENKKKVQNVRNKDQTGRNK